MEDRLQEVLLRNRYSRKEKDFAGFWRAIDIACWLLAISLSGLLISRIVI